MKIKCPQCDTYYDVSDEVANSGAQVQCAKCANIFTATPVIESEMAPQENPQNDSSNELLSAEEKEYFSNFSVQSEEENSAALDSSIEADQGSQSKSAPLPKAPEKQAHKDEEQLVGDIGWAEPAEPPEPAEPAVVDGFDAIDSDLFDEIHPPLEGADEPSAELLDDNLPEPEPSEEIDETVTVEQPARRFAHSRLIGWGALAASLLLLVTAASLFRTPLVRAVPGLAGLYEKIGFPVNIRGLEFAALSHQWMNKDGQARLVVRGEIVNITNADVPVPEIVFSMLDANGREFFQWTERANPAQLLPGARTRFRAQIPAPANRVKQLKIRFAKQL